MLRNYQSPLKLAKELSETFKKERSEYQQIRQDLINDVHFEFPKGSTQKIEAVAFKRMNQQKEQAVREQVYGVPGSNLTFTPDMTLTIKHDKVKNYNHNGKWGPVAAPGALDVKGQECWSCCMSTDKDSEGCAGGYRDKQRWVLSSYT